MLYCAMLCYIQVGVLAPEAVPTGKLCTGQVGYLITGMKTTKSARVGDTWHLAKQQVEALPGFKPAKSMVFSGHTFIVLSPEGVGLAVAAYLELRKATQTSLRNPQSSFDLVHRL